MSTQVSKIFKNTTYLYGNTLFSIFVSLLSTRLILNALGVSDFGIFCIVGGAIGMLGFINGAMAGATQRFINYAEGAGEKEKQKRIFNTSILIHIIISIVVIIALEIAFIFFFNGILNIQENRIAAAKWVYQLTALSTILTVLTTPYNATINAHEDMKYYSIIGIIFTLIKLIIAIIIVYSSCDKLILYSILITSITFLNFIIVRIYCHKRYNECKLNLKKYYDFQIIKSMFSFASFTFMTTATSMFSVYGGNIIINNFFGTSINAAQGVANQISGQLMVFSNNMLMAVNPVIGKKAGAKDFKSMIQYALSSSKLSYFMLLFFAMPFIIETNWIMKFWLKNIPEWAIIFCRLEITRKLLDQLLIGLRNSIISEGNIKNYSITQSILYILPLPITYILFSHQFSPIWLYLVWIIILNLFASFNILKQAIKHCGLQLKQFFILILRCLISTSIIWGFGLIPHLFFNESFLRLIIVCLTTSITFILTFWYIATTKKEKNILQEFITKILHKIRNEYHN